MTAWTAELTGRRIVLDTVHDGNAEGLHHLLSEPGLMERWPLRGLTLSPGEFCRYLQSSGDAVFVVSSRSDGKVLGFVAVANLSYQHQTCELVLALSSTAWKTGWPFESLLLIMRYVFQSLGMRRANLRVGDAILDQLGSETIGLLHKEGTLSNHTYVGGAFEDVHLFSVSSEDWRPFSGIYR